MLTPSSLRSRLPSRPFARRFARCVSDVRWTINHGCGRGRVPISDDEISAAVWRALVYARRVFHKRMEKFSVDESFQAQCSSALERKAATMRLHYLRLRRRATIRSVECGLRHSVLLTAGGEVWTCGAEGNGQLGRGDAYYQAQFMVASEHSKNEQARSLFNKQREAAWQARRMKQLRKAQLEADLAAAAGTVAPQPRKH